MTRQRLQSAIKPWSERSLSLARLPDDLHFQALTGQRVFRPVSYLNQGQIWRFAVPQDTAYRPRCADFQPPDSMEGR